ncbi:glutaminyl-tRNA synthase (glutamine-hydrolyzing) subunit B [Candidatus Shapirobacteria bacterium RBG_13_44_7]|uniref:Aspartyl/glutamyl-tRNA(Asn/Gln) amidotransferase subunit B n=1 Tax=Candidatus Shapirobacteria bacterium RBG_13_44_7 TaxID=1802149 RepID=A0A1F7SHH0_9BACT|nr:MAG: glutaminyl-tRNA synthase (glutamine-hydrolyzing) subunit B [Candidatus Shapirobacteria bacterium RBG_13_44_7]
MKIIPIIGLEVHVELKTKSKMFCGCDTNHFHAEPNTHTCPVCLGLPGALPVPNKTAVDWCLKLGLALNCSINHHSFFERKNYFYPDLPKGYQISQYQQPFCINGKLGDIRINRVHQEEDTGKSVHLNGETLLDFNRSGVPLVEIVSEPDINSPENAKEYLQKIQQIVRYLDISDADIEKGSMRCEPTVNLDIDGHFTPLVEIKNVASLTGVLNAIQYEIDRQSKQFEKDQIEKSPTNKTTRGWDANKQQTFLQREKEGSADYRYFPEPDIPPIEFSDTEIEAIHATIPELPDQKIAKYKTFGLSDYDAQLLADDQDFATAYEKAAGSNPSADFAKFVANLFIGPLKQPSLSINKINPIHFQNLFNKKSELSSTAIKQLIVESYSSGADPLKIAADKNLFQVSDTSALEDFAKQVIAANPKAVEDYKKNPLAIGFLVGQLMKISQGSANPQLAKEILEKLIKA